MRRGVVILGVALAASARANGAMGLGLEVFRVDAWWAYVVVTIIFEAWLMGRWLALPLRVSLPLSLLANTLTGFLGLGCGAPFFHEMSGHPRPFLFAVGVLTIFAFPSALVEAFVWLASKRKAYQSYVLAKCVAVHLIGIPVALVVLLIPSRPYPGLERSTGYWRGFRLNMACRDFPARLEGWGKVPHFKDGEAAVRAIAPDEPDAWQYVYQPAFGRFDLDESRRGTAAEWNHSVEGLSPDQLANLEHVWLFRWRIDGYAKGVVYDAGRITMSGNEKVLGW